MFIFSSSRLSPTTFFPSFLYFLNCAFSLSSRLSCFSFFLLLSSFLYTLFFTIEVNTHHFLCPFFIFFQLFFFEYSVVFFCSSRLSRISFSFLSSFFNCYFPSSPKVSRRNFFLLSFSLELRFVNFHFTGDFTLFELVFSFCWSIANFDF